MKSELYLPVSLLIIAMLFTPWIQSAFVRDALHEGDVRAGRLVAQLLAGRLEKAHRESLYSFESGATRRGDGVCCAKTVETTNAKRLQRGIFSCLPFCASSEGIVNPRFRREACTFQHTAVSILSPPGRDIRMRP